jgi:cytochrome c biogenesis protein CcdA/glutaredoxin
MVPLRRKKLSPCFYKFILLFSPKSLLFTKIFKLIVILCIGLFFSKSADAFTSVEIVFFHETGCPECARVRDFLENRLKPNYDVIIHEYEIHAGDNAARMLRLAEIYGPEEIKREGTPVLFIGEYAFQGSSRRVLREIEQSVRETLRNPAASPLDRLEHAPEPSSPLAVNLSAVLGAAAVDSVNPCACAVLVLLLGTMMLAADRSRRRILGAGFAFSAACYIAYYLMGLGLFTAVQSTGIQNAVYIIVAVLATGLGLWNLKDASGKKKGLQLEVPKSWQPLIKRLTSGITSIPGAFFTGIVVSLLLLPCTSGPYVVIIGMLSRTSSCGQALWLLGIYNLVFVLPFILITLGVGFGLTTLARVERWRQRYTGRMRIVTGIFMLALGAGLLLLVIF